MVKLVFWRINQDLVQVLEQRNTQGIPVHRRKFERYLNDFFQKGVARNSDVVFKGVRAHLAIKGEQVGHIWEIGERLNDSE